MFRCNLYFLYVSLWTIFASSCKFHDGLNYLPYVTCNVLTCTMRHAMIYSIRWTTPLPDLSAICRLSVELCSTVFDAHDACIMSLWSWRRMYRQWPITQSQLCVYASDTTSIPLSLLAMFNLCSHGMFTWMLENASCEVQHRIGGVCK